MASTSTARCLLGLVGVLWCCLAAAAALPVQNEPVRDGPYREFKGESNIEPDDVIRHLDSIGGDHLLRSLQRLGAAGLLRRAGRSGSLDSLSGVTFGGNKRYDPLSGKGFGSQKRNFDEIDRTGFNSFVKKNFDEIDRSGFDSFVKKNFDEIDRAGFGGFVKRGDPWLPGRYYEEAH
ncbi:orcokinin peptides type A-like [Bacillus rossius redtenbacheri]|uniref:orcokinin peptides type A-like n=1 Tax=Bacillus rossius redtenbacheri TaxID=93214 RepID=UPI002FDDF9AA